MAKRKAASQPAKAKQEIVRPTNNYMDAEFINKWRNEFQAHTRRLFGLGEYPTQYAVMIPATPTGELTIDTIVLREQSLPDETEPFTYVLRYMGTVWNAHEMYLRRLGTRLDTEIGTMESTLHVEVDGKVVMVAMMISRNPNDLWDSHFITFKDDTDMQLFHKIWYGINRPLQIALRNKSELFHTIARNPALRGIVWLNPDEN